MLNKQSKKITKKKTTMVMKKKALGQPTDEKQAAPKSHMKNQVGATSLSDDKTSTSASEVGYPNSYGYPEQSESLCYDDKMT